MFELIVTKGTIQYDITNMIEKITWGGRKGAAPRNIKVTMIDYEGDSHNRLPIDCEKGDKCTLSEDGNELFRGQIVRHQQGSNKKLVFLAYDNAFSLVKNKDSFSYTKKTATEIFRDCMTRLKMDMGTVAKTTHVIPDLPKAKTTYWDVLLDALSSTYAATGRRYYIYSEKGIMNLRLRTEYAMKWVLEAGSEQSNIISYDYTKSIEKIKTRVRLLSKRNSVVYEKSNTDLEKNIGTFTEVKSLDSNYSQAQMQELVDSILNESGKPESILKITSVGVSDAITGRAVYVIIPHLGIERVFYIDEDIHEITRESHTMTLKLNFAADISSAG